MLYRGFSCGEASQRDCVSEFEMVYGNTVRPDGEDQYLVWIVGASANSGLPHHRVCMECALVLSLIHILDLTVEIENGQFDEFCLELAHNMEYTTTYTYNRKKQIMEVDRTCCGVTKDVICRRIWKVTEGKETLKLRFILDRQSIELFVNDGEQVVTTAICTPMEADEIVFSCDGKAKVNVEKYEIVV